MAARRSKGARYWFRLDDGTTVPDPASRWQAEKTSDPHRDGTGAQDRQGRGPGRRSATACWRSAARAQKLALDGALPWDIDRVLYDFGFPMGPFAMSDLAGLDLGWVREKSTSSTLREILCEMDRCGQKTGAGYYDYDDQRNARPSPVVDRSSATLLRGREGPAPSYRTRISWNAAATQ